jgi:heat shock protein HslJ
MRRIFLAWLMAAPLPALAADLPLTARGNEPFWTLEISADGLTYTRIGEKGAETWPLPPPVTDGAATTYSVPGGPVVTVTDMLCRDDMSGMPFPAGVTLALNGETLSGCAGEPGALLTATPWRVTEAGGAALPADVPLEGTLAFDGTNVSGKSFCNRFTGGYTLTGEGLSFGPLAGTRMACGEPQGSLEPKMLGALAATTRFDIADDGALVLYAGDTPALRALPAP